MKDYRISAMLLGLLLGASNACSSSPPEREPRLQTYQEFVRANPPADLTVMSFNIWGGGVGPQYRPTLAILKAAGADIIGIQESAGAINKFAEELGFYGSPNADIISRYPIVAECTGKEQKAYGVKVFIPKIQRHLYVFNSHLQAYPYSPHQIRDGLPPDESFRHAQIKKALALIAGCAQEGDEILFVGDHNTVSHVDWKGRGYDWPVTRTLFAHGFIDSYREIYPDVGNNPGITWSPGYPGRPENDTEDRIDYIYYKGILLRALSSTTLDATNSIKPWPSDHRAVLSEFSYR